MKKFEHILIASDIDGTLLWKSQYIHPRNFEKLHYFCENGGHFALSTGRNCKDICVISEKLQECINMPCILCNGSYLFDFQTKEILNPHYLNPLPLIKAFQEMKSKYNKIGFRATVEEGFLCPEEDDIALEFLKASHLEDIAFQCPISEFADKKYSKPFLCPTILTHYVLCKKNFAKAIKIISVLPRLTIPFLKLCRSVFRKKHNFPI